MNLSMLEQLLGDRIGLDVGSVGTATLPRVVAARMAIRSVSNPDQYTSLVANDASEWTALVGELVVPETWFDRGGVAFFEYLARWVRTRLADSFGGRSLRALCVPCSTGEEPYSLAFALDRQGVPATGCTIEGVDIAGDHLLRAVSGRFHAFSFRESNSDPRPKYLKEVEPGKWEVLPEYRDRVHFRPGNLVDPGFLAGEPPYDLILCRNLFIYLTAAGAARAISNLERLLAPDGILCVTAAEADRIPAVRFVPEGPASLAIYRRQGAEDPPPRSGVIRLSMPTPARVPPPPPRSGVQPRPAPMAEAPVPAQPREDALSESRRLADAGDLAAARITCESAPPSAGRFSLLGVIHLAAGRTDDATDAFRKALYLDPDEPEALNHMIVLCEQRGDPSQAAGLRRRLDRLEKGAHS